MTDWHPYSHGAQSKAVPWIGAASVLAAFAFGAILSSLNWAPPWWLDTPAVAGFYGILCSLYDRALWRMTLFRRLHGIPNLSGTYAIKVRTSHDGHSAMHEGAAVISQSWTHIVIRLDMPSSLSTSKGAWLVEAPGAGFSITYAYTNTPKATAALALSPHDGTAIVTFSPRGRGEGAYYTGRGRANYGELAFEPKST
jgi:hypothetical protein